MEKEKIDKNLETGLLIGAGLGLALAPVIKKIAKSLPGINQHLDSTKQHIPLISDKEEHDDSNDNIVKFIPFQNTSDDATATSDATMTSEDVRNHREV